jgi:hypothetical protein
MSPEQIAFVTAIWRTVTRDPQVLDNAIAERLPGPGSEPAARAVWIVRAVSRLSRVLDHPTRFAPMVADMVAERIPVTIDTLAADRDALLGALRQLVGPLGPDGEQAWSLAIGLFAEVVADLCLDPFACCTDDHATANTVVLSEGAHRWS